MGDASTPNQSRQRPKGDEEMKYETPTKEEIGMAEMKEEESIMRGENQ